MVDTIDRVAVGTALREFVQAADRYNDPRGGQLIRRVSRRANPQAKGGRTSGQRRATQ